MATKKKTKTILRPPPGSYDPVLDANERAANRGLKNLLWDTDRQGERLSTDFTLGQSDLARQRAEFGEDITTQRQGVERSYGRSLSDLLTERTQTGEDYTRNLAQLQRNYDQLGNQQAQRMRQVGVQAGGARAQAARKRAANQAWEKAPVDTSYNRAMQASQTNEARLGEDKQLSLDEILRNEQRGYGQLDRSGGELNLNYGRGAEDLSVQLQRAQRENVAYGQDVAASRQAQYRGTLMTAPVKATKIKKPKVIR